MVNCQMVLLKPLSQQILLFLYYLKQEKGITEISAEEIAEKLNKSPRAINASITKALIRWSLVKRTTRETQLTKKLFKVIQITEDGNIYSSYLLKNENEIDSTVKNFLKDLQENKL